MWRMIGTLLALPLIAVAGLLSAVMVILQHLFEALVSSDD